MRHMRETAAAERLPEYRVELDGDLVVFWRRAGDGANAERPSPVTIAPEPAAPVIVSPEAKKIFISSKAIERAREIAPGMDAYWLENTYIAWAKSLEEPAHNEDARFLSWVGSYTKNKRAL